MCRKSQSNTLEELEVGRNRRLPTPALKRCVELIARSDGVRMGMHGAKASRADSLIIRALSSQSKLPCDKSTSTTNACAIFSEAFCTSSCVSMG